MKKSQSIAIGAVASAVSLFAGVVGVNAVLAQNNAQYPTIVENIATTFNLDPSAVQDVFVQTRVQNQEQRLTEMVTEGKITEEQKVAIIAKQEELRSKIESLKTQGLSEEDLREQMKTIHAEMRTWMEEQGIEMGPVRKAFNGGERLEALVEAGTITAEQKTSIETKMAEQKTKLEALKSQNLSDEDFKTQMDAIHAEMKAFMESQGLTDILPPMGLKILKGDMGGMRGGPGRGFGGEMSFGQELI